MKTHRFLFLIGALLSTLFASQAAAQTCRITSGISSNGSRSYMEVYEYDFVEEKPQFPGGGQKMVNFINDQRRYPAEAYARGIEGRVMCSFVVNADGTVSHISVLRGVEPTLNREALRILSKMPAWQPGKLSGHNVPVRVICAVPFRK
ncbi:MAG: energy transducer TonB [Muribaculaceae bacterium]|nr:energy transducer TonB [Muribaculaceae bacterium]MDE6754998.1 energy transducer TonB [Muribaculaceae bacterium]